MTANSLPAGRYLALAAGGTGGHVFPALALAAELRQRGWPVALISDRRGERFAGSLPAGVICRFLPVSSLAGGSMIRRIIALLRLFYWSERLVFQFLRRRPACVVAFGGYGSVPALVAAFQLRVPRLVHEQNAVLGRANRLFLRLGATLACGMTPDPASARPMTITGNPVRDAIRARAGSRYQPPGSDDAIRILAIGGSQGSRAVADIVSAAAAALPRMLRERIRVTCQTREENLERIGARFEAAGIAARIAPFFDDLPELLENCHLVVARSGASTLAEISTLGRPSILIPLPTAANDHQSANARSFAAAGAAAVVVESGDSPAELAALLEQLAASPERVATMAGAAAELGRPEAAQALADLVEARAAPAGGRKP